MTLILKKYPILGVVVGRGEVQIENNKIKMVKEWKTPTKIKEVKSFLGFAKFYQCFINNFSHMAKPLNKLRGKKKWKQKEEHQKSFKELKDKIISQLVLALPKREEKFRVKTDALGHEIGEVLFQE